MGWMTRGWRCGVLLCVACAGDDVAPQGEDGSTGSNSSESTSESTSDATSSDATSSSGTSSDASSSSTDASGSSSSAAVDTSESGGGSTEDESTTGAGVCSDAPLPDYASAIAYRWADIPPSGSDDTGDSSGPDPDTLLFGVRSYASTCADEVFGAPCDGNWTVHFQLAPDVQVPGVYDMEDVVGSIAWTDMGGCGGGGGSITGTIEIVSIDDDEVIGRFCDVETDFGAPDIGDGEWTAARCP